MEKGYGTQQQTQASEAAAARRIRASATPSGAGNQRRGPTGRECKGGPGFEARLGPGTYRMSSNVLLASFPPVLLSPTLASFPGRTALCGDRLAASRHPHNSQPRRRMCLFPVVSAKVLLLVVWPMQVLGVGSLHVPRALHLGEPPHSRGGEQIR